MRIHRRSRTAAAERALLVAAAELRGEPPGGRVCGPACASICPKCGQTNCRCACAPTCEMAPRTLSSDPDNNPIEAAVVPLVYELQRLGLAEPCWSCEGHLDPRGALWKLPRIWFYCDSPARLRLLADALDTLATEKRLSTPWRVGVAPSERDNPDTIYQLEPSFDPGVSGRLSDLQRDIATIADNLDRVLRRAADSVA